MSNKSFRIRTKPGGDDNYIRVKLDQDFNQLKILSLSIDQEDLYRSFNANYGVVAGRIDINNGFGLKNAKVSIFIPLSTEDQENEIISQLYPYKSLEDLNSNGVRYNLLPRKQQHIDHTPTGTFPDKRQVLDSPTMVEVYDKYYKFTTTTNEAGDYMFFGVPVGSQQVFIDIDVSDIGFLSARPYELISQGIPKEKFENNFKFKSNDKLDELPQVISTSSSVEVLPFWADDLSQGTEFGITRFDYSVTEYELTPTAIFMGSMFSDNENDALSKNCRPRKKMGEMNDLITGAGKIEAITRTKDGEIVLSKDIPDDAVDENGNWAIQVPMTMRKLVTDETGALVPSPDGKRGIASEADYRFRISMEPNKDDKKKRTRAKLLVPNMTNNYKFGEFSKIDLTNAEAADEPIFKVNEQLSYDYSSGPLNQYNYLEDFFTFRWKKVYTIRQYIPRHQPNKNDKNKNFIGFKNISDAVGVNKIPFNRLFTKINPIYSILCFILTAFAFIVGFINSIIQVINSIISNICEIRIPFPCLNIGKSAGVCRKIKYRFDVQQWKKGKLGNYKWKNRSPNVSSGYANYSTNAGVEKVSNHGDCWVSTDGDNASWSGLKSWLRYGSDDRGQSGLPNQFESGPWIPSWSTTTIKRGNRDWWYSSQACRDSTAAGNGGIDGCTRVRAKSTGNQFIESPSDLPCNKETCEGGFAVKIPVIDVCIKVILTIRRICIVKGLCNTCSNDDECGTGDLDCTPPKYGEVYKYKWNRPSKTDQGKCLKRAVFTTSSTIPTECSGEGLDTNTKYFVGESSEKSDLGSKKEACDYLDENDPSQTQIDNANNQAKSDAENEIDDEEVKVFKCNTTSDCDCKKGGDIGKVKIGCLRALGYGELENTKGNKKCAFGGGSGTGINEKCCSGCADCAENGFEVKEDDDDCAKKQCPKDCLAGCCEKIPLIKLSCPEQDLTIKPQLFAAGRCVSDLITECVSCKGTYYQPITDWVSCRLEAIAKFFNMLDFEFYNDWMNGSLYFPLIKRKLKIKRAKKAAKGKSLKRGQGQIKKDSFCDYDCDGGNNEPDYQHPDKVDLYSVKLRGGGKQEFTFEGCKVNLPRRISAKQWYEDVDQVYKTIEFKGNQVDDITKACTFTLSDYCSVNTCNDGVELNGTTKKLIIKTKKVPGEHGKPKYIKIGAGTDGDGKKISVWENVGGHGHQRNKCKKNYFIEKEEYTKTDLSDCKPIKFSNGSSDAGLGDTNIESEEKDVCDLPCTGQGAAACNKNSTDCECDEYGYNIDPNYRGIVKWEDGEIYYTSIKDEGDEVEDKSEEPDSNTGFDGKGSFDDRHYKKNMFFPTNITELGSSVFCDIDEAPFIMDQLEPTTYRVSEEELSVGKNKDIPNDVTADYVLKEKEGNINLNAYIDFGCTGVRCMNVRASLTEAQVGTELFDLNDTGLECGTCTAYVDVDTDVRQYFCQRFSTFVPETNGNVISNMKVNYMRPGGSQGENYYEPYNDITATCGDFENKTALVDGGTTQSDVINIDNGVNDGDAITPGDKCGYLTTGTTGSLDFQNVKYFYGMDLSTTHTKNNLKNYPFEESKLGSDYKEGIDVEQNPILVNDDEGISPFTTQTPYFFYFGLVPGKTALNKVVGKFFADKINAETLETISNGGTNETNVPPNSKKTTSPQSIVGSCINS
jgi:hypothetical protein